MSGDKWYKKWWVWLIVVICIIFVIPLAINYCYTKVDFCPTDWNGGDALQFYGAILSFLGTVALGAIAVWQNKNANEISKKLLDKELNESCSFANILSVDWKSTRMDRCTTRFENLHSMESTNVLYIENITIDDCRDRHFVEYLFKFTFENTSNAKIKSAKIISKSIIIDYLYPIYTQMPEILGRQLAISIAVMCLKILFSLRKARQFHAFESKCSKRIAPLTINRNT